MASTRALFASSLLIVVFVVYLYADSLVFLISRWFGSEDYSHGLFVPLISGFLIWQSRHRLYQFSREQSWWGLAVIGLSQQLEDFAHPAFRASLSEAERDMRA